MNNNNGETLNVSTMPNFSSRIEEGSIKSVIQTLAYDGKLFEARVVPFPENCSYAPYHTRLGVKNYLENEVINHTQIRGMIKTKVDFIQTNFYATDIEMLKMYHPKYGWIYKSDIGKPFKLDKDGDPLKGTSKWILKSFNCNELTLEANIFSGLFMRKVYKFI